jgi:hypothetical protein
VTTSFFSALSAALAASSLHVGLAGIPNIISITQTVHILALCVASSSAAFFNLRVLGVFSRRQPLAIVARRFLPWAWWPFPLLLATGAVLTLIEPDRELFNPAFRLKMVLILVVLALTAILQLPLRGNLTFWEASAGKRILARLLAVVSLALWISILVAGRMIAYNVSVQS